jgi:bacillithiol biosynthesis cysteine-adding enzyme BshC
VPVNSTEQGFAPSGDIPARIAVDVRRFPWIRRFAADYAFDFRAVAPFFSGDPADSTAWTRAIAATQGHVRGHREIATLLAAQQERRGAPAPARHQAQRLADAKTVAVVTGQQAGLFGGPLFTLLKAITAIKLAERVSIEHQVAAVAIFWIDAEDHDWDEVRSGTAFDAALTTHTVALASRSADEPLPVASVRLDDSVTAVLDQLEQILPPTEFRAEILAKLRDAYTPGVGMAEAFGRWLESVLGDRGLVLFDSSDPAAKPLVRGVFTRELSQPGETARRAALAGADLVARGYHSQVTTQADTVALFRLGQRRQAIRQQDGHFVVGDEHLAMPALQQTAAEHPESFSPNVLLRPIVQDTLFPTICYVAGPNELAYLGQLRGVYEHFDVPMPLIYPRASATLVDSAAVRFLTRYDVALENLQAQDEAALNELLKTQIPESVDQAFGETSRAIETQMGQLVEVIPAIDPTLEATARSTLGRMQHDLQTLHAKMIQAAKRRDETLRRQFIRTRALAFPDGHAQERTIAFVSFLNQYGPSLVDRLDMELPLDLGRHWIITI